MNFNIPYFYPPVNFGYAPVSYGQQAGAGHFTEQATRPMIQPMAYNVKTMGMLAMPFLALGQTPVVAPNTYLGAPETLEIAGIYKSSIGG